MKEMKPILAACDLCPGNGDRIRAFVLAMPESYVLHQALAQSQNERGTTAEAIRSFEAALKLNPRKTEAEQSDHNMAAKVLAELKAKWSRHIARRRKVFSYRQTSSGISPLEVSAS
jgi:hypothetical protein